MRKQIDFDDMYLRKTTSVIFLFIFSCAVCSAQTTSSPAPIQVKVPPQAVKSSPAYAAVLLRKTEATAELEDLLVAYTEDFPKVKQLRSELVFLKKEMNRFAFVSPGEASKLSEALGKLVLRKVELELEYENLQKKYPESRTEVKQAKRKVEIFEAAIQEIIP